MHSAPHQDSPDIIRRRAVFVMPGYDPAPPRRYREIYRREAARQGMVTGQSVSLTAAERPLPFYGWQVQGQVAGQSVSADFWLLPWNDLVQRSMRAGVFGIYALAARTALAYLRGGSLVALFRLRWQPMLAVMYPLALLLGQVILLLAALRIGALLGGGIGMAVGAVLVYALAEWLRRQDRWHYSYYLLHLYAFAARNAARPDPELAARMDGFADAIEAALADGVDEVLVVGHSLGAQLAVDLLGEMQRAGRLGGQGHVSLLTLGQVIPMISFLQDARGLRRNLAALAEEDRVFWLDVSSQADGGCFALCDPVAVSGVARRGPKVVSAAFADTVAGAEKQRFFDRHFQYFRAFAHPQNYDYFAITAGPQPLRPRYAARKDSPQVNRKTYLKQRDSVDG